MKIKTAILAIVLGTTILLSTSLVASALQENVITCETQLNQRQLEIISALQRQSSNRMMVAQYAIQMQIHAATGIPGPLPQQFRALLEKADRNERGMLSLLDQASLVIEKGCDQQRSTWYLVSTLVIALHAAMAGFAFWLGIRASHSGSKSIPTDDA